MPKEDLKSSSRKRKLAYARSIVAYAAIRNLGYKATEVAEVLSLSRPTVSQNVEKGKIFLLCREINGTLLFLMQSLCVIKLI